MNKSGLVYDRKWVQQNKFTNLSKKCRCWLKYRLIMQQQALRIDR